MANTAYRRQQDQQGSGGPGWVIACGLFVLFLCLVALPWILLGFVAQRSIARWLDWLNWRITFLFWLALGGLASLWLSHSLQPVIVPLLTREADYYIIAARAHQWDLLAYPLRQLWAVTWPVWIRTWPGIAIAGFVSELLSATKSDLARTLRRNEQRRQRRAQHAQNRARRRSSRPATIPDEVGGQMVMGIPIRDDEEA